MTSRFHPRWLALVLGVALVALSASSVLGAKPAWTPTNPGQEISVFVHDVLFGDNASDDGTANDEDTSDEDAPDEDTPEDETPTDEDTSEDGTPTASGDANSHGQCVADEAQTTDVGGANENHGGAVSEAARVTCWGEDSQHAQDASTKEKTHGHGHGHGQGGDGS